MRCRDIIAIDRLITLATVAVAALFLFASAAIAGERVASGEWTKKSFDAAGTWSIEQDGDDLVITLSDDFRTRNAPDLKLFFSPIEVDDLNGKNATDGALLIAELQSNRGGQAYRVSGVDPGDFQSIIIHCEQYSKLWSAAAL